MESTLCWLSDAKFSFSSLQPHHPTLLINKCPPDYSTDHCAHLFPLSSFFFLSLFQRLHLSFFTALLLPQTLHLYMFPSSSLAVVMSSLLLNLFLSQSVSLLSSFLMRECESSLGVLLYFLGSAVVDWNGGLCHFYLLPH